MRFWWVLAAHATKRLAVSGMEPSNSARSKAEKLISQSITTSEDNLSDQHDVITLWACTLNTYPTPIRQSRNWNLCWLKMGTSWLPFPIIHHNDGYLYGTLWAGYDVPRHLWHFNEVDGKEAFAKHGLTVKQNHPNETRCLLRFYPQREIQKVGWFDVAH